MQLIVLYVEKKVETKTADAKEKAKKVTDAIVKKIDQNGNGAIDIEDVIILGMNTPGVRVNRAQFLENEFFKNHSQEQINKIIASTPAKAGISEKEIDRIANNVIKFERTCVSGISTVLGVPGGLAMVATVPADVAQYYGYLLRATQKLLYLYGFPQIDMDEKGQKIDTEIINIIIMCMGVMYGVAGADFAIKALAKGLAAGIEKKILKTALTKTTFYPIVKKTAQWFGVNVTKDLLKDAVKKTIPFAGGIVSGGITFLSFKPCCDKLKKSLSDTMLSNPNHVSSAEEDAIILTDEDVEITDIE